MRNTIGLVGLAGLVVSIAFGCGSSTSYSSSNKDSGSGGGQQDGGAQALVLTIGSGMRFMTPSLVVPAGTSITVRNEDSLPHTVTSETAPDAFTPSGQFDTGIIAAGQTATIAIPADAVPGTVYYYYCTLHRSAMTPANGMITVQ